VEGRPFLNPPLKCPFYIRTFNTPQYTQQTPVICCLGLDTNPPHLHHSQPQQEVESPWTSDLDTGLDTEKKWCLKNPGPLHPGNIGLPPQHRVRIFGPQN